MAVRKADEEFWREFIGMYRVLPELWKVKCEAYKNRNLKNVAYDKLVRKMQEIDSEANRDTVRKKINCLRSAYRRELRKLSNSKSSGAGTDDLYVPSLWYFDEIDFLRDQEIQVKGTSSIDDCFEIRSEEVNKDQNEDICWEVEAGPSNPPPQKSMKRKMAPEKEKQHSRNKLLEMAFEHLRTANNEAEVLGKTWAFDYIKLKPDQQVFAKKFINDILYEGRLGNLHRYAMTINEPFSRPSSSANYINIPSSTHAQSSPCVRQPSPTSQRL